MRWRRLFVVLSTLLPVAASAADPGIRLELNALEPADHRCRLTFVIENKSETIDSLKLEIVVFNTDSVVYRRMVTEMAPLRAGRTMVKTFAVDTECTGIGSVLVNEVTACAPGDPNTCLDGLALSSRVKNVRLYK